tara:strand:- start:658 stop:885 length:228 start_codon:yes stop_codon:yes gene_type:complete
MIDTDMAEQILQGDDTLPVILQMLGLELLAEVKRIRQDTLKVVSEWFDSDENEWRKLEQALGLPLTPLSWEGEEE